jgi:precorrin-8X/cobalt-precorrin-8 methylmutase
LEGLARFSAIEAAEVEAAPAWIHGVLDQAIDGPIPRRRVISPDQMDGHRLMMAGMSQDHPIFTESIRRIRSALGDTGLDGLEQQVLERLIHSSGDLSIGDLLHFSPGACEVGVDALQAGALILTDTAMAAAAVRPMARRTLNSEVRCLLEWAPDHAPLESTRTAAGMYTAWKELVNRRPTPVVLIGSAPTALEELLACVHAGAAAPSVLIGMPVGFVGVPESKRHLAESGLPQIRLEGTRGGAGLVAAAVNALLRSSAK